MLNKELWCNIMTEDEIGCKKFIYYLEMIRDIRRHFKKKKKNNHANVYFFFVIE